MTTVPTEGVLFSDQKTNVFNWINVIEKDLRNDGNVLVGTINAIFSLSLDNDTSVDRLIAGGVTGYAEGMGEMAQFNGVGAIIQHENSMLILDAHNHCLRKLEMATNVGQEAWETSLFAGLCETLGDTYGRRINARFSTPWDAVKDNDILYIADSGNAKIKQLDLVTNLVTSVYQTGGFYPFSLVLGESDNEFYVTAPHGILHIKDQAETWLVGSATLNRADTKGKFSVVGFESPRKIRWLDDSTLIVADSEGDTVKVIDLQLKEVQAICTGPGNLDGNTFNCELDTPQSLLVDGGKIYVGCRPAAGALKQIEYSVVDSDGGLELNCEAPPQQANAEYASLDKYPIGTDIEYTCINRYVNQGSNNSRSVCVNGGDRGAVWSDVNIKCQLSAEMVAVIVLAVLLFVVSLVSAIAIYCLCKCKAIQPHGESAQPYHENYTTPTSNGAFEADHPYNPQPLPPYPKTFHVPDDDTYDEAS